MSKAAKRARKKENRRAKLAPLYDAHLDFETPVMVVCDGCAMGPQVRGTLFGHLWDWGIDLFTLPCQCCGSEVCEYAA